MPAAAAEYIIEDGIADLSLRLIADAWVSRTRT